jgi:Tfp pilus assembly protein PilF
MSISAPILLQQGKTERRGPVGARAEHRREFADAQANLGNVRLAQGRLDAAEQCYQRALALKPDVAEVDNNLGLVLAARGDSRRRLGASNWRWLASRTSSTPTTISRACSCPWDRRQRLDALRRALAIGETAQSKALFVQCARVLPARPMSTDCGPC